MQGECEVMFMLHYMHIGKKGSHSVIGNLMTCGGSRHIIGSSITGQAHYYPVLMNLKYAGAPIVVHVLFTSFCTWTDYK